MKITCTCLLYTSAPNGAHPGSNRAGNRRGGRNSCAQSPADGTFAAEKCVQNLRRSAGRVFHGRTAFSAHSGRASGTAHGAGLSVPRSQCRKNTVYVAGCMRRGRQKYQGVQALSLIHIFSESDLRPLFAKFGAGSAGKIIISLKALEQLSLIENKNGCWRLLPVKEKKDLFSAPVLQKLEE